MRKGYKINSNRKMVKPLRFKLGDLVQLNSFWDNRIGIVKADDRAWWVIEDYFDIDGCIVKGSDVAKVIKRNCIKPKWLKYVS